MFYKINLFQYNDKYSERNAQTHVFILLKNRTGNNSGNFIDTY